MQKEVYTHQPVMLDEVLNYLDIRQDGMYVDATFGRGGHSAAILNRLGPEGRLFAMDKDAEAVAYARHRFASDKRFIIQQGSFAELHSFLMKQQAYGKIDGILFDLGVSSPQLDDPDRGFSFMRNGKLDMRMDTSQGIDATTWIATASEQDLSKVFWEYGEERFSRRIAKAIVAERAIEPITTTHRLAEIISAAIPAWPKGKHPATRCFQAIRIEVNHELEDLQRGLEQSLEVLRNGGRLLVMSFHSLEDRLVKHFIQNHERGICFPKKLPIKQVTVNQRLKRLGSAIKPTDQEMAGNPRSRSAVLRIAEKVS